jgi:ATP-dependent RNA helicase DHX37/DHR1
MEEIHKLRSQICNIVGATFPGVETGLSQTLKPPSDTQVRFFSCHDFASHSVILQLKVLRQLLTAAFINQVAVRKDLAQKKSATGVQYTTAKGVPYRALGVQEDVFIHPSSVLSQRSPPDYVVFTEIVRTTKPWLKGAHRLKILFDLLSDHLAGLTLINPAWLSTLGKPTLCTFTKPAKNSAGVLMTIPRFGPDQWELPPVKAS